MELGLTNTLLAGDPRLVEHIVGEVKSQGIFDQFRKECIADVDTKPAYQNLRTRVEGSVNSFLNKQIWKPDLNKNQLREILRKHIHEAPYLDAGVERIVDQVVNPKVYSVFMPQIEDVVYKFLGMERPRVPSKNGTNRLKDLLPKDLDPVSPESDRNSLKDVSLESTDANIGGIYNGNDEKSKSTEELAKCETLDDAKKNKTIENGQDSRDEKVTDGLERSFEKISKSNLNASFKSDDTNKTEEEEEESPMFEPIDIMNLNESNMSNDSHLSGISELTSHRSRSPDFINDFGRENFDFSNADSHLSKVSSNSRLSIVTDFENSNHASTPIPDAKEDKMDSKYVRDHFKAFREVENSKNKDIKFSYETKDSKSKSTVSSKENSRDANDSGSRDREDRSKLSKDKSSSKNQKDKDSKRKSSHNTSRSDKHSKSKSKDRSIEIKDSSEKFKDSLSKKDDKSRGIDKKDNSVKEVKDLKDIYKEKIRELREKKELTEKEKLVKEAGKSSKDSKDRKESSTSKDRKDYKKEYKSSSSKSGSSNRRDRSKGSEVRSDSKDKSKRDERRHSRDGKNEKNDKGDKINSKSKRDNKTDFRSRSTERHDKLDKSSKDKKRRDDKKKYKDDHSSLRKSSNDRRSTDRDGSNGSSSKSSQKSSSYNSSNSKLSSNSNFTKDNSKENNSSGDTSDSIQDSSQLSDGRISRSGSNMEDYHMKKLTTGEMCLPLKKRPLPHDETASTSEIKMKKPKIAKNGNEARKLMKIKKQIQKKEVPVPEKEVKRSNNKEKFKLEKENAINDVEDLTSVPDEERVQIIEIPYEDYDETYSENEMMLSLEETSRIILEDTSCIEDFAHRRTHSKSTLSEMELSIRQSLSEMMSDHKLMLANNVHQSVINAIHSEPSSNPSANDKPVSTENSDIKPKEVTGSSDTVEPSKETDDTNMSNDKKSEDDNTSDNELSLIIDESDSKDTDYKEEMNFNQEKTNNQKVTCNEESTQVVKNIEYEEKIEANCSTNQEFGINRFNLQRMSEKSKEVAQENFSYQITNEKTEESIQNIYNEIMGTNENIITKEEKKTENDNVILTENEKENKTATEIKFTKELSSPRHEIIQITDSIEKKESNMSSIIKLKEILSDDVSPTGNKDIFVEISEKNKTENIASANVEKSNENISEDLKEIKTETEPNERMCDEDILKLDKEIDKKETFSESITKTEEKIPSDKLDKKIEEIEMFNASNVETNDKTRTETIREDIVGEVVKTDTRIEETTEAKTESCPDAEVKMLEDPETETESEFELKLDDDCPTPVEEILKVDQEMHIKHATYNEVLQESKTSIVKTIETEEDTSSIEINNKEITAETSKNEEHSQVKNVCYDNTGDIGSPVEEECLYLDADNERSLRFAKFIATVEAENENPTSEQKVESVGTQVVTPMEKDKDTIHASRKRPLSPLNIIINNTYNNIEHTEDEQMIEAAVMPEDETSPVAKKRKLGRSKKEKVNASNCNSHGVVNGENFIMPLSPDSDVSTSNEKSVGNPSSKEEKSRQRSSQRYSSDDLYKPRPLFSSSSRRNRRSNQA